MCVASGGIGTTLPGSVGGIGMDGCLPAPIPLNGQIQYSGQQSLGSYPTGTAATLICNPGSCLHRFLNPIFFLGTFPSGQSTASCRGGSWTPPLGVCTSGIGSTIFPGQSTTFPGGGAQCLFGMVPPPGGFIQYSQGGTLGPFFEGTSATLICSGGAIPTGTSTAICRGGQWIPTFFSGCSNAGVGGLGTTLPGQVGFLNDRHFFE